MPDQDKNQEFMPTSRRQFLKTSAVLAGTAMASQLPVNLSANPAGSDAIKIGLIGCGGRGTAAAINAMNAGQDIRLVALADVFEDWLQTSRQRLKAAKGGQVSVDDDHCFVGFDAYKQLRNGIPNAELVSFQLAFRRPNGTATYS
jgi:hypothetical protein